MSERIIVSLDELVQSWINDPTVPYRIVPTQTPQPVYERLGPFSKVVSGISILVKR